MDDHITGEEPALPTDADQYAPMLGGAQREKPIVEIAKEAYNTGYEKGHDDGYSHGFNDGYEGYHLAPDYTGASIFTYEGAFITVYQKSHALGYREGYDAGYNQGHDDGVQEAELEVEESRAGPGFDEDFIDEYELYKNELEEEDLSPEMMLGDDDEWEEDAEDWV